MPSCGFPVKRVIRSAAMYSLVLALLISFCHTASAQNFNRSAVGGVTIDANGVLNNASVDQTGALRRLLSENAKSLPGDLKQATKLRKVSLRRLAKAIEDSRESGQQLSD